MQRLALAAALCLSHGAVADRSIPVVSPPPGSHYEVLKAATSEMKQRMKTWVDNYPPLEEHLRPYARSAEGAKVVAAYVATNKAAFPHIWEELRGMADGSGLGLETIVLMQLRVELLQLIKRNTSTAQSHTFQNGLWESMQECSDVLVNAGKGRGQWHAHNEDAAPVMKDTAYILNATFLDSNGEVESGYLSMNYPLSTAGHSLGFNIHGIHISENSVTPKAPPVPGDIGSFFLSRHILDAKDFNDVVRRARLEGIEGHFSAGASLNVGSQREALMGNVEVSNGRENEKARVEVKMVGEGQVYHHFNMYLHSDGLKQVPQASSEHRLVRAQEMEADAKQHQTLFTPELTTAIVSDAKDKAYPVYRTNATVETAATGLFDMGESTLSIWFKRPANPSGDQLSSPDFKFDLSTREMLHVTEDGGSPSIVML